MAQDTRHCWSPEWACQICLLGEAYTEVITIRQDAISQLHVNDQVMMTFSMLTQHLEQAVNTCWGKHAKANKGKGVIWKYKWAIARPSWVSCNAAFPCASFWLNNELVVEPEPKEFKKEEAMRWGKSVAQKAYETEWSDWVTESWRNVREDMKVGMHLAYMSVLLFKDSPEQLG
ncbi:hypothetical protein DACRYDRAFT_18595 [Dacryopinax primogenitus]|uniref:Uncharacterized protein n=1 Tax=Dacryopinax primogenitus (strain DJM 731) TaxID=1858805 RepID=M5FQC1_DACPD|nr:uncharacterized protein DACRYDRAFT_18595 [Dacryopinax primogenitus]EJT97633.1 hypothetical protein DACRYDRAFT_18595 [Dacryopinax primogenitus]